MLRRTASILMEGKPADIDLGDLLAAGANMLENSVEERPASYSAVTRGISSVGSPRRGADTDRKTHFFQLGLLLLEMGFDHADQLLPKVIHVPNSQRMG